MEEKIDLPEKGIVVGFELENFRGLLELYGAFSTGSWKV